jgi:hypothetical protein
VWETLTIGVMTEKEVGEIRGDNLCHLIGLYSLFQRTLTITRPQNRTVQLGNAFEESAFKRGLKLSKFNPGF